MGKGFRKTGPRFSFEGLEGKDEPISETEPRLHRAQKTGEAEGPRGKVREWLLY